MTIRLFPKLAVPKTATYYYLIEFFSISSPGMTWVGPTGFRFYQVSSELGQDWRIHVSVASPTRHWQETSVPHHYRVSIGSWRIVHWEQPIPDARMRWVLACLLHRNNLFPPNGRTSVRDSPETSGPSAHWKFCSWGKMSKFSSKGNELDTISWQ